MRREVWWRSGEVWAGLGQGGVGGGAWQHEEGGRCGGGQASEG